MLIIHPESYFTYTVQSVHVCTKRQQSNHQHYNFDVNDFPVTQCNTLWPKVYSPSVCPTRVQKIRPFIIKNTSIFHKEYFTISSVSSQLSSENVTSIFGHTNATNCRTVIYWAHNQPVEYMKMNINKPVLAQLSVFRKLIYIQDIFPLYYIWLAGSASK